MTAMSLVKIASELAREVDRLEFGPPVTHVYNPLLYAREPHRRYLERYGAGPKQVLLLGMNPGPFGMAQTGVPFGDPELVREFLGIDGVVKRPPREHPKRPVSGFACERGEVSGRRLWGWVRDRFGAAERFFERFFIVNYCPLVFVEESGRNRTPDKLPAGEQVPLFEACDRALRSTAELLRPRLAIGVGAFAEKRIRVALEGLGVGVGRILHPSPASPLANRGWAERAERQLEELGVELSANRVR
jgi:single-strand selective monofunctional uracil DNA glycosylase